jgi:hypothetical protein
MFVYPPTEEFKRNAVEPIECLKAGWQLVKNQYWLFVGMSAVGWMIGYAAPFGLLMGPMMCGMFLALFQKRRGQPLEFGILFKGFEYFGNSVVATLLHAVPILVIVVPLYIGFVGLMVFLPQAGNEPDASVMLGLFGFFMVFWFVLMVLLVIVSVGFIFAYPLIVDRKLSGLNAVKLSIKAAMANFWRLLGLMLITGILNFVGIMLCGFGLFFVLPVTLGAIAIAYEQVFGLGEFQPNVPPPPPTFA